jgi:DNA-binding SARP family transcriptional activator/WD40 repeat protein
MDVVRRAPSDHASIGGVEYMVLGSLRAVQGGVARALGGHRQRMVLAILLANVNRVVSQDALIDAVWSGDPPEAGKAIQSYVSLLRKELGGEIVREGDGYRVAVSDDQLDAARFERLVAEGRARLQTDPASAVVILQEALALWYGLPYGDLGGEPALTAEVVRLEELRLTAVEHRIRADLAVGNHDAVIGELETLIRENPYRERLRELQMLALYRSGRQVEALRSYQRARTLLSEELGIDPSVELRDLEQRILNQDPALDLPIDIAPFVVDRSSLPLSEAGRGRSVRGYELRERVGEGDFGVVYRAYQPTMGREVAVKVIRPEFVNRPDFVHRFEAEAQLIGQLEHPHVVELLDFWRDPEGAYLVTPLMRGGSLAEALQHGPWNLAPALKLLDEVGRALGYAHRRGVIHRDLKPGNVLLDEEGNAYLTDFGIAVRAADAAGVPMTTSLAYLSPEESRGELITSRADIYSLGVLTFHLLTGVLPMGRSLTMVSNVRPGLSPELGEVLARATDDRPANRYERVEDFLRSVRRAVGADVVAIAGVEAETARESTPPRNPYKGLRSFTETDALDFHGRAALIDELLEAVGAHPLVAVVGPSGSGKSSVVRAGLVPALRAGGLPGSRGWLITEMFPGSYPFEELEAALLRVAVERPPGLLDDLAGDERGLLRVTKQILPADESRLLLIMDQFEELFSAVASEETRRLFLENLVTVASDERSRVRVVLTMRADFFDRPLEHPEFGALVGAGLVTVSPPTKEGLAQAVAAPARGVGVELEPGLVGEIIHDVEGQPGALPLLQYALTELFSQREGNLLTIEGYRSTGGVLGALGGRAEELYEELSPQAKEAARQLFLRLVTVDELSGDARRRVRRTELKGLSVDQGALDTVLHQFGSFRLLSYDRDPVSRGPTVEVAHEALLREWDRLAGWIDGERENLLVQRRISGAAREWVDSRNDPSFLLRGGRLEQAERWEVQTGIVPSTEEAEFLEASRRLRHTEARTARRRRRMVIGLLAAGLAVATLLASLALWQRSVAQREARQTMVYSLAGASATALDHDPELAILLAIKAAEISQRAGEELSLETVTALQASIQTSRLEMRIEGAFHMVEVSADGSLVATDIMGNDGSSNGVAIWDPVSGELLRTLVGPSPVTSIEASPSDTRLAVGYEAVAGGEATVLVWEPQTGEEVGRVTADGEAAYLNWNFNGSLLVSVGPGQQLSLEERQVTVWDTGSMVEVSSYVLPGRVTSERFLDETTLAVAQPGEARVSLYDVTTGEQIDALEIPGLEPEIGVDSKGGRLVVAGSNGTQVWDLESRSLLWSGDMGAPREVDPDRGWMAVGGYEAVVTIFDLDDGSEVMTLSGHIGAIDDVAFDPSRDRLYSTADGETLVWDITPAGPVGAGVLPIDPGEMWVSPDGGELAIANDLSLTRYHSDTGAPLASIDGFSDWFLQASVSPDWRLVALAEPGFIPGASEPLPEIWVRDLITGERLHELPPCVWPRAFSSNGSMLVLDGADFIFRGVTQCAANAPKDIDHRSRVVDPITGEVLLNLGDRPLLRALFNPGGVFEPDRYLAIRSWDPVLFEVVEVHDMLTGSQVATLDIEREEPLDLAFDPTGQYLAVGGQNSHAWVVDVKALVAGASVEESMVMYKEVGDGGVAEIALGPNGLLATSAFDPHIRLWDIHTGELLRELERVAESPPSVAFNPEGDLLYGDWNQEPTRLEEWGKDGSVIRFFLDNDRLVEVAKTRVTRDLTPEECQRYRLDPAACP